MRRLHTLVLALAASLALGLPAQAAGPLPAYIIAAVNDPGRPENEKSADARRKPVEMLAFMGIRPGYRVVDFLPGEGYFTRIFSKAVGVNGRVYALDPDDLTKMHGDTVERMAAEPGYKNITLLGDPLAQLRTPEPVDVVWTSQNYHDLHNADSALPDVLAFNKRIYSLLKPGGVYIVLDHRAAANAPVDVTKTLHRIDPETVKKEVLAAGFKLEAESDALANPADDHSMIVFNPKIRGKTDQFVLKFRKPS